MKTTESANKGFARAAGEAVVVLFCSATIGIFWNHSLLLKAWRGEATSSLPAASAISATSAPDVAAATVQEPMPLGLEQAKELLNADDTVFIDARDRAAFASGHLKGALSLPLGEARRSLTLPARVNPKTVIITYCNGFSCHDSMELAKILLKAGYATVYVYEGGYPEWRDAGNPVEKGGA